LATGEAPFGPLIVPAYQLCPIYPGDSPKAVGLRALTSLVASIETYADQFKKAVPGEVKKIAKWVRSAGGGGFEVGIQILGTGANVGRQTTLPSAADASFESIRDALTAVAADAVAAYGCQSVVVVLDNVENLDEKHLTNLLLTFRDTLFMAPSTWWIIIGQSGLASQMQTIDPRISDRLSGPGLELRPLTLEELDTAISKRVARFNIVQGAKSPLPEPIHRELYDASNGEIRFVFKYSSAICARFVEFVRKTITRAGFPKKVLGASFDTHIAKNLINKQIPENIARDHLKSVVEDEVKQLLLKPKDRSVLRQLYKEREARSSDHQKFGVKSPQAFSSNYLSPFFAKYLLSRRQQGAAVYYSLRGVTALAAHYGVL